MRSLSTATAPWRMSLRLSSIVTNQSAPTMSRSTVAGAGDFVGSDFMGDVSVYCRSPLNSSLVIPGKLAIASATRNLGILGVFDAGFHRHGGMGDAYFFQRPFLTPH